MCSLQSDVLKAWQKRVRLRDRQWLSRFPCLWRSLSCEDTGPAPWSPSPTPVGMLSDLPERLSARAGMSRWASGLTGVLGTAALRLRSREGGAARGRRGHAPVLCAALALLRFSCAAGAAGSAPAPRMPPTGTGPPGRADPAPVPGPPALWVTSGSSFPVSGMSHEPKSPSLGMLSTATRTTATVNPLTPSPLNGALVPSGSPATSSALSAQAAPSSSFAAALRKLAKQAEEPRGKRRARRAAPRSGGESGPFLPAQASRLLRSGGTAGPTSRRPARARALGAGPLPPTCLHARVYTCWLFSCCLVLAGTALPDPRPSGEPSGPSSSACSCFPRSLLLCPPLAVGPPRGRPAAVASEGGCAAPRYVPQEPPACPGGLFPGGMFPGRPGAPGLNTPSRRGREQGLWKPSLSRVPQSGGAA